MTKVQPSDFAIKPVWVRSESGYSFGLLLCLLFFPHTQSVLRTVNSYFLSILSKFLSFFLPELSCGTEFFSFLLLCYFYVLQWSPKSVKYTKLIFTFF